MKPIAILFALRSEAAPFLRMLRKRTSAGGGVIEGQIHDIRCLVAVSGMGYRRAQTAASAVLSDNLVNQIIAAGFAGALHAELRPGDLIIADQVIDTLAEPVAQYPCSSGLTGIPMHDFGVCVGSLLTMGHVITTPQEKACLYRRYRCDAVDMESSAIAAVAHYHETPFSVVRAIMDPADEALPPALTGIMQEDGSIRIPSAISALVRHPRLIREAGTILRQSRTAARNLAAYLRNAIAAVGED